MKRNSKQALATLSILLFSSLLVSSFTATPVRAVDYTRVGVKVGDWAYYSTDLNFTGVYEEYYLNLTFTQVVTNYVEGVFTIHFPNGTSATSATVWGNVSSGEGGPSTAMPLLWFVLAPNLAQGDPVFVGSSITVNDTGTMVAAGAVRTYAHANLTIGGSFQDFRMDQATGIGIQGYVLMWAIYYYQYIRWSLNATSLWSPQPSFPLALLLAVSGGIAIVAIVVAIVVLRKRHK